MRTHSLIVYILVVFLLSSGSVSGKTGSSVDSVVTEYGYPSYPGGEEELKNFIISRLDFSKYPHKTNYEYTADCWIDTLGKVKQVIMNYRNENSEWEDEIANALYAMPDWQFPTGTIKDSALVAIPLLFVPINQTIDLDEEYESNEIFKVQIYYPEFPGGINGLEYFFTKSMKRLKIEEKDRLTGDVICRFRVNRDGSVVNAHVIKRLGAPYDAEILRMINSQPTWKPGSARGKPTSGICEVTISFGEHEVQNGEIKKIEFVELLNIDNVGGGLHHPVEKGYERISKKYRSLNDITIEFDN